jgi:hypothetical protein
MLILGNTHQTRKKRCELLFDDCLLQLGKGWRCIVCTPPYVDVATGVCAGPGVFAGNEKRILTVEQFYRKPPHAAPYNSLSYVAVTPTHAVVNDVDDRRLSGF